MSNGDSPEFHFLVTIFFPSYPRYCGAIRGNPYYTTSNAQHPTSNPGLPDIFEFLHQAARNKKMNLSVPSLSESRSGAQKSVPQGYLES